MPDLLFIRRGEEVLRVALGAGPLVIGRGEQCDVTLPDPAISRRAVQVQLRGERAVAIDLSGKGLALTGVSLPTSGEHLLDDGAELALGEFRARFRHAPPQTGGRTVERVTSEAPEPGPLRPRPARLTALSSGRSIPLGDARVVVGNGPGAALTLDDPLVSRDHFEIVVRRGCHVVRDLESTNGTRLEGMRVGEAELVSGARLRVGATELRYDVDAADAGEALPGFFTTDPAMLARADELRRAAASAFPICVLGETGTGKDVVARAIHALSPRAKGPYLALNCGGLDAALADSQLFGHERGAFTGADRRTDGLFVAANGGTLFLDEIGDLPLAVQVKLLRTLENGEVRAVGSTATRKVDVRIVAATNKDLFTLAELGRFREDLLYRLNVYSLTLPPLRARRGDILPLAERLLAESAPGEAPPALTPAARDKLLAYDWPGNVRQLRGVLHGALILSDHRTLTAELLRLPESRAAAPAVASRDSAPDALDLRGRTLAELEDLAIRRAFERHKGDRPAMLAELQVSRSTLYRKLSELGLDDER